MKNILVVLFFLPNYVFAQDPHFSMPYATSLQINPAFAGVSGSPHIQSAYRNQWPGISGSYVTSFLSYDQYVRAAKGGVALNYLYDVSGQGTFSQNRVGLGYSYIHSNSGYSIAFGLDGAYAQRKVNWEKLSTGFPVANTEAVSYFDFSSGVLFYKKQFYAGFAAWHMTEPDEGFASESSLPIKYVGNLGVNIGNPDSIQSFSLTPSLLFMQQGNFQSLVVQCAMNYYNCAIGIGYRNADAIIASLGFRTNSLQLAYSHDLTISRLGVATGGSHEISLSLIFNRKAKPGGFTSFSSAGF